MVWSTAPSRLWGSASASVLRAFSSRAQSGDSRSLCWSQEPARRRPLSPGRNGCGDAVLLSWPCSPAYTVRGKANRSQLRFSEWPWPACSLTWEHQDSLWLLLPERAGDPSQQQPLSPLPLLSFLCHQHLVPLLPHPPSSHPKSSPSMRRVGAASAAPSSLVWQILAKLLFSLSLTAGEPWTSVTCKIKHTHALFQN